MGNFNDVRLQQMRELAERQGWHVGTDTKSVPVTTSKQALYVLSYWVAQVAKMKDRNSFWDSKWLTGGYIPGAGIRTLSNDQKSAVVGIQTATSVVMTGDQPRYASDRLLGYGDTFTFWRALFNVASTLEALKIRPSNWTMAREATKESAAELANDVLAAADKFTGATEMLQVLKLAMLGIVGIAAFQAYQNNKR